MIKYRLGRYQPRLGRFCIDKHIAYRLGYASRSCELWRMQVLATLSRRGAFDRLQPSGPGWKPVSRNQHDEPPTLASNQGQEKGDKTGDETGEPS